LLSGRDPSTFPSAISAKIFYIIKVNKFRGCQGQQSDRFKQNLSSTSAIVYIVKIFTASSSRIVEFIQVDGSMEPRKSIYMLLQ
jgi:hypothetical protein